MIGASRLIIIITANSRVAAEPIAVRALRHLGPEHRVVLGQRRVALHADERLGVPCDGVEEDRLLDRGHESVADSPEHRVVGPDRQLVLAAREDGTRREVREVRPDLGLRHALEHVTARTAVLVAELRELGVLEHVQQFRLEMPDRKVTKGPAADARVRVDMRREFFNVMAREGKVADWIEAFTYGQAKASGPEQFLRLIVNVVDKQQERQRTRKAHH